MTNGEYHPQSDKDQNEPRRSMPEKLKDLPSYILSSVKEFLYRLYYVFRLIWQTSPGILLLLMFFSISNGIIPVVLAYINKDIINDLVYFKSNANEILKPLILIIIVRFATRFVNHLISLLSRVTTRISGELITKHIKLMIAGKTKNLDLASFDNPEFYERLENAEREAGSRPINIINSTFDALSNVISMISFIAVLAVLSPIAPVIIIILSFPSALINFHYRKKTFKYVKKNSKGRREMNYFSNILVNKDRAKEIRLLSLSETFIQKFKDVFQRYFAGIKKLIVREGVWQTSVTLATTAGYCLLFMYIAYNVVRGDLQIGDYTLYTGAITSISGAVSSLIMASSSVYEGTLFIDNLILFMNEETKIKQAENSTALPQKNIPHTIEFRHVYFKYPGTERYVLEDVNFTIAAGSTSVLVGLNGSGKTTLIKLLTRLYDPTSGTVLLDGTDIREFPPEEYHKLFGILFQDFGKYAVLVKENITFGDVFAEYSEERVKDAAVNGDADDFIMDLPENYSTPLTRMFEEDGIELSGGQWQKLSISRAYYKVSDILILDEPTASLDAIAEQEIFNKFDELRNDKTTLFVTHRLSSAVNADNIIVLADGKIKEQGTHEELMELDGQYAEMFRIQADKYNKGSFGENYAEMMPRRYSHDKNS